MKITLDIDKLLDEGKITKDEYDKLLQLSSYTNSKTAFNILVSFGVIGVVLSLLMLIPSYYTAIISGAISLMVGIFLIRSNLQEWKIVSNILILIGALMVGGGVYLAYKLSLITSLGMMLVYLIGSIVARSPLLALLATYMLSVVIGVLLKDETSYIFVLSKPTLSILIFTSLLAILYQIYRYIAKDYKIVVLSMISTIILMINASFFIGSLFGDKSFHISSTTFALTWAIVLILGAIFAWYKNNRWLLNISATFGSIHLFNQWFIHLKATPISLLIAGVLALIIAIVIKRINSNMARVKKID